MISALLAEEKRTIEDSKDDPQEKELFSRSNYNLDQRKSNVHIVRKMVIQPAIVELKLVMLLKER